MGKSVFCFLLLCTCLLQISCKEDPLIPGGGAPRIVSMQINGTLPYWNYGDGYRIIVVSESSTANKITKSGIDTAYISNAGEFTLVLHALSDNYYSAALYVNEPNCDYNINPSPYYMKTMKSSFEIYQGSTYKGLITGRAHHVGNDSNGTYFINYQAFSSAGTITGNKVCVNTDTSYTYFYDYNLNTIRDWTPVITYVVSKNYQNAPKTLYSITGNDPQINDVWEYTMN